MFTRSGLLPLVLLSCLGLAPTVALAEPPTRIDFETIGGGPVHEGLGVSDQFVHSQIPVTFLLDSFTPPVIAEVGPPLRAFSGFAGQPDTPEPATRVGRFFLTDYVAVGGQPSPLNIGFGRLMARVSGEWIDIDGAEAWTAEAYDQEGHLLDTVTRGPATDGSIRTWDFSYPTARIGLVRLRLSGPVPAALAVDNLLFSTSACLADLDTDGVVDFTDYLLFLNFFEAQDPRADFTDDAQIDFADYLEFLNQYDQGC